MRSCAIRWARTLYSPAAPSRSPVCMGQTPPLPPARGLVDLQAMTLLVVVSIQALWHVRLRGPDKSPPGAAGARLAATRAPSKAHSSLLRDDVFWIAQASSLQLSHTTHPLGPCNGRSKQGAPSSQIQTTRASQTMHRAKPPLRAIYEGKKKETGGGSAAALRHSALRPVQPLPGILLAAGESGCFSLRPQAPWAPTTRHYAQFEARTFM